MFQLLLFAMESPLKLQDYCLEKICNNVETLCCDKDSRSSGSGFHLPTHLSEQFLLRLNQSKKLTDKTLLLFNENSSSLRKVDICNANITVEGLQILRQHKLLSLRVSRIKNLSVDDIIGCLNSWSLANLRHLNVSHCTFISNAKVRAPVLVSLTKLKNVQSLNVSNTEFNETGLEILAQCLTSLVALDVSSTSISELDTLPQFGDRLRSLTLHNLHVELNENTAKHLLCLRNLRHIDVSSDHCIESPEHIFNRPPLDNFLQIIFLLPNLVSLDLSGQQIKYDLLKSVTRQDFLHLVKSRLPFHYQLLNLHCRDFVESRSRLQFLGLLVTQSSHEFEDCDFKVSQCLSSN